MPRVSWAIKYCNAWSYAGNRLLCEFGHPDEFTWVKERMKQQHIEIHKLGGCDTREQKYILGMQAETEKINWRERERNQQKQSPRVKQNQFGRFELSWSAFILDVLCWIQSMLVWLWSGLVIDFVSFSRCGWFGSKKIFVVILLTIYGISS